MQGSQSERVGLRLEDSLGVRYKEVSGGFKNPLYLFDPLGRRLRSDARG